MNSRGVDAFLERDESSKTAIGFLKAARCGDLGTMKGLLKLGADPKCCDDDGNTGLHLCAGKCMLPQKCELKYSILTSPVLNARPHYLDGNPIPYTIHSACPSPPQV